MRQSGVVFNAAAPIADVPAQQVPLALRLMGKLIVEVLPAALASAIGAFLFAHYQFGRPAEPAATAPAASAVPASSEMLQVVREEHSMLRDLLAAKQTAEQSQVAAVEATDTRAAADAKPAGSAAPRAAVALASAKPAAPRNVRPPVAAPAATASSGATAELTPIVITANQQVASVAPPPPPATAQPSLVSTTLAVPGHVVSMTLHAVMAIGGIPSWIGHRVGATDLDTEAVRTGATS